MQKKIDDMKAKMEKTLDVLAGEFKTLRAGRANPAIIDKVNVDYYGVPTPINQLAVVNVPEARTLTIQPSRPLREPSMKPTSASIPRTTARLSASFFRRSPRNAARNSPRKFTRWARTARSPSVPSAATRLTSSRQ